MMRIPWIKVTVLVLFLVLFLKLGGVITEVATTLSNTRPGYVQAQEAFPTPGTDPVIIPNNPDKQGNSIDLSDQNNKANLLDQETRSIIEKSETPFAVNTTRNSGPNDESLEPEAASDWAEEQLSNREQETFLSILSKRLDEREAVIRQRQAQLEETLKRYDSANDERILRLVSIYSTMKSKAAAEIFDDLDLETLVPVAQNIIPRKLAPILAAMKPEQARILSEELSGRNKDVELLRNELDSLKKEREEINLTKQAVREPQVNDGQLLPPPEEVQTENQ